MNDFKAQILAELDTSKVEQQINNIGNGKRVKLNVDTGNSVGNIKNIDAQLKSTIKSASSFGDTIKRSLGFGSAAALAAKSIHLVRDAYRSALEAVKEYDDAIKNIRIVTSSSYSEAAKMLQQYNQIAQTLGATTKDVADSAVTWLRQGKTGQEANTLIYDSMMLAKNGMIDSASAAKYLTSAMNGYKVSAEDAVTIVDKLSKLDSSAAITAGGLSEAMAQTAVTASDAGVEMDKLLSYLTIVGEVTQKSMTSIGTSFKTIFTRMSDIKTGKLELIDEDGTSESLSDVETVLTNLNIKLRTSNNEFRNFGDVLDEVGRDWNTYSDVQQAAIAKAFAGTKQQENFRVLMANYENVSKYMEISANSAGAAEKKFVAYTDSIEAKTKSLQAAFEELANHTLSSETFGGIVEATTDLVNFLDKTNLVKSALVGLAAAGTIKLFSTISAGIMSASIQMSNFNSALAILKTGNIGTAQIEQLAVATSHLSANQLKAVLSSEVLSTEQRIAILTAQGLSVAEAKAALSSMGLAAAEGAAAAGTVTLDNTLKGLWNTLKLNPMTIFITAITVAMMAVSHFKEKAREAQQAIKDLSTSSYDKMNTAINNTKSLDDLISRYKDLAKSGKQDAETRNEILSIQNDIVDIVGDQAGKLDLVNGKLDTEIDKLKQIQKMDLENAAGSIEESVYNNQSAVQAIIDANTPRFRSPEGVVSEKDPLKIFEGQNYGDMVKSIEQYLKYTRENYPDSVKGDYYKKLSEIYNELAGQDGEFTKYQESAQNWLSNLTQRTIGEGETIESIDEYYTYRQSLIDSIMDDNTIQKIVSDGVMSQDEIRNYVDTQLGAIEEYTEFYKQWANDDNRQNQLKELSKAFRMAYLPDNLDTAKNNNKKKFFDTWISGLSDEDLDIVYKISLDTNTASWGLLRWQAALEKQKQANEAAAESNAKSLTSIGEALDEDTKSVEAYIKSINSVEKILSSQKNGKSVSLTDFNTDELKDYRSALEYVNGTMQLNVDKVNEIAKAKAEEQIEVNKVNKAMAQSKYLENARQIATYREEIKTATDEKEKLNLQTKVDDLLAENEALVTTCTSYDLLSSSLREATSSYQHWLNAMNASDYGDMFTDAQSAIKRITDTFNEDSDIFGQFGSKKFDAAVDFIIPDTVDTEDVDAIQKYMDSLKQFFYYDDKGEIEGLDIEQFCKEAVIKGLMVFDQSADEYKIAGGKTMEDFAEGLKLSSGLVQAFFDEMQLYGGKFDWGDEAVKTMGDLAIEANEAAEALRNIPANKDLKIKLDYSDIDTVDGQLKAIDGTMKEMEQVKAKPNVDSSEIEYANSVLEYCLMQKQALTAPDIMRVDVSQVKGDLGEAITLLQEFQDAQNQKEILKLIGADTSGAEAKINELGTKIQGISPDIKTNLKLNTNSTATIQKSINGLSAKALVKLGIDESAITGYNPETKECEVIYKPDTDLLPEEKDFSEIEREVHYYATGLGSLPSAYELGVINREVHYYKTGDIDLNGTAHASGTAKVGGDWGTAKGGKTLMAELGTEIIVDPHTGRWYTVGENGAQFVDVPEGAIVFNHIQTKSLLENGYVSGRAHALVSGTAMVTGGIKGKYAKSTTTRKNKIEQEVAEAAAEEIANSTPDGGSNNPDDSFKYIDRVEIFIDRIQRKIKTLSTSIKDIFSLWSDRGSGITQQIRNITEEIDIQKGAAKRYLEEARKQIDKYDLDPEWVKSLETGNLGFIYLTNLDELDEGYRTYLSWYEKYLDCRDSIVGLEQDLSQLYKDQFDNIKSNYENQINLNDYLRDAEEKTYSKSTDYFNDMRNVYSKNLELLTKEAKELETQLQKAVNSGAIEEGSEAWQEMKSEINGVTKEISKTNVELAKLYTEQFEYIQSNYKNQIDSYESLNDANEKTFTKTTKYYSEMRNIHKKTLSAQEKELEALEKEFDEAMDSKRIEQGSEAWYKMRGAIDDTKRSIAKTKVELKQLYLDEFSYIQDGFKNQLSLYEHYSNVYQKKATIAETQGYMASAKTLAAQKNVQAKNTSILRDELSKLEQEFSEALSKGEIEEYSDAWYSMRSAINATKEAIYDSRIETEKLNKAMRELDWTRFDFGQTMAGQLNDEADFLMNMMSFTDLYDKKGRLTDTGLATMGLHNMKIDVYNEQSKEYLQEMTGIELQLYNDPDNVDLINRKQELLKLSRETAIAMENEQKAIISMVENGIKLELDSLKELIDTYKEALDSTKDLYDYQNSIADKSKKISDIQKQLTAYANDSSEETKAIVQKLQVDLSDAQKDLRDTEYTRSIADQKKLLDDLYTEYESFLNTRLDDTNRLLEDMRMVINAIPDRIGEVLRDTSLSASIHISTEMNGIWNEAAAELQRWNENAEAQQQITRDTLNAADASWGSFGDALRGSVVDKYSETNDSINGVGNKADNIKTAVDMNAHGIETIFSDLEHQSGQIVANADSNADGIKDEIYKRDNTTTVQNGFTTTNDALKKISETVEKIEKKAEEMAAPYMGDVDLDDDVTSADSLIILRSGIGLKNLSEQERKLADMDGDGEITAADALMALRTGVGLEKKVKAKSYSTGGLADYTGVANIHGTKDKPELVLNADDTKNFIKLNNTLREIEKSQTLDFMSSYSGIEAPPLQLTKIPSFTSGMSNPNINQDVNVTNNIEIERVLDYNDFVNQMVRDKNFEKFIQSISVDRMVNGRPLDKYKYRW